MRILLLFSFFRQMMRSHHFYFQNQFYQLDKKLVKTHHSAVQPTLPWLAGLITLCHWRAGAFFLWRKLVEHSTLLKSNEYLKIFWNCKTNSILSKFKFCLCLCKDIKIDETVFRSKLNTYFQMDNWVIWMSWKENYFGIYLGHFNYLSRKFSWYNFL